jgi:beta-glucosidase
LPCLFTDIFFTPSMQAIRFLTPWIASGQPEKPLPNATFNAAAVFYPDLPVSTRDVRKASTMDLIRTIGEDSAVLLKNEANALPLKKPGVIAILGSDAGPNALGALVAGGSNNDYPLYNQASFSTVYMLKSGY